MQGKSLPVLLDYHKSTDANLKYCIQEKCRFFFFIGLAISTFYSEKD